MGVKETIRLGEDVIAQRFQLKENEGSMYEFFGGLNKEGEDIPFSMGFYTLLKTRFQLALVFQWKLCKKTKLSLMNI